MNPYIEELRNVIRRLHGAEALHVESVPVKETLGGQTVWDGTVEVFDLQGHPKAKRAYAWAHETDEPTQLRRYVTVLHISGVTSAVIAVKAAILEKFERGEPEEA
jgi:hypothetical protein